jgi:hypothetical protein
VTDVRGQRRPSGTVAESHKLGIGSITYRTNDEESYGDVRNSKLGTRQPLNVCSHASPPMRATPLR